VIYFMQPTGGGAIKIGFSEDVERRRIELEVYYKQPLAIIGTMEGERRDETIIHRRFKHLRLGRTEQFSPAAELLAFIGRPLLVGPNPDAVEPMTVSIKPIRLDFSPEVHQMLRIVAAERGKPMAVFAREAIEELVRKLYDQE
jgi:hypothetical protein